MSSEGDLISDPFGGGEDVSFDDDDEGDDSSSSGSTGASTDEQEADVVSDPFDDGGGSDSSSSSSRDDDDDGDDGPTRERDLVQRARETEEETRPEPSEPTPEEQERARDIEPGVQLPPEPEVPEPPPEVTVNAPEATGEVTVDIGDREASPELRQAVSTFVAEQYGAETGDVFSVEFQDGEAVVQSDVISNLQQEQFQEASAQQAAEYFGVDPSEVQRVSGEDGFVFTPAEGAVGDAREAVENRQQFGVIDPGESDLVRRFNEIDAQLQQPDSGSEVSEADLARRFTATQEAQRNRDRAAVGAIGARTDERESTTVGELFTGRPDRETDVVSDEELFSDEPTGPGGIFGDPLRGEESGSFDDQLGRVSSGLDTASEDGLAPVVQDPIRDFFGVSEEETRDALEDERNEEVLDSLFGSGGFLTEEEEDELREQSQGIQEEYDFGAELRRFGDDIGLPEGALSFLGGTPEDIREEDVITDPFTGESGIDPGRNLEGFGGVGALPGQLFSLPQSGVLAGESVVEATENVPGAVDEFGVSEVGSALGAEATLATGELTEQAERDPAGFAGEIGAEVFLAAGAGRAVTRGADFARSRRVETRGEATVDLDDISPTETLDETTGIQRFETDPGEPTSRAVSETRRRAADQPDELQEAFGEDLLFRSESEALSGPLEAARGEFELPGLFTAPDLSRLRLTEGGESAGLGDFRLGLPRVRGRGEQVTLFEGDRIEGMPDSATGSGFAVRSQEGDIVDRFPPTMEGAQAARRLEENIGGQRVPDPDTTGAQFLDEQAERGTAFVRPPGSRSRELEAIFPPETEFVEAGRFAVQGEGNTIPGLAFRRADDQPDTPDVDEDVFGINDLPEDRISGVTRGIESEPTRVQPSFVPGGSSFGSTTTASSGRFSGSMSTGFTGPTSTGLFTSDPAFETSSSGTTNPFQEASVPNPTIDMPTSGPSDGPSQGPTGPGPSGIPETPLTTTIPDVPPSTPNRITPGPGDPSSSIFVPDPSQPPRTPTQLFTGEFQSDAPEPEPRRETDPFGEEFENPFLTGQQALSNPFGGFL